uniref:ABC transporter domain-containing protein n=1 Tax=Timema bartmani TaxID=61472 RepID=A0A7R9HWF5_9NEOP|nr:unnamed protein product [Timema bartmani]
MLKTGRSRHDVTRSLAPSAAYGSSPVESNMDVEVGPEPHGLKKCQQSLTLEFTDLSYNVSGRKGSEPIFAWMESGKPSRKSHPSSPNRDSNLDLPSSVVELNTTGALANYTTETGQFQKSVLRSLNGRFKAGRLTAIIGPSGAGKSTLLNIVSGFKTRGVQGSLRVNGEPRDLRLFRRQCCYIAQEFAMLPRLTTVETLTVAAELKLGRNTCCSIKETVVKETLELLGLVTAFDTLVQELSGGEKKRLSIALELLTNPPIMLFDEPTSGLDSSSSVQVMNHLKSLADGGHTVVCVIHQPSSRLFQMFDDVLVLSEGRSLYCGPIHKMVAVFEAAGFGCPNYYNRSDFAIEVACRERGNALDVLVENNKQDYVFNFNKAYPMNYKGVGDNCENLGDEQTAMLPCQRMEAPLSQYPVSIFYQFYILFKRSLICTLRDSHMAQIRPVAHVVVALMLGAVYYNIGNDAAKVSSNTACLFFFIMFLFFANAMPTVQTFPLERAVFLREHLNNWYSLGAYYLAKVVADLPLQVSWLLTDLSVVTWCKDDGGGHGFNLSWVHCHSVGTERCPGYNYGGYLHVILAVVLCLTVFLLSGYFLTRSFKVLCPTVFLLSGYFLTGQPCDLFRLLLMWAMCLLLTMIGQTLGLVAGAAFDSQLGVFLVAASTIPMFMFSGFFMHLSDIPFYLRWLSRVSYFRYDRHEQSRSNKYIRTPSSSIHDKGRSVRPFLESMVLSLSRYAFEAAMLSMYGFERENLDCSVPYCHYKSPTKLLEDMGMAHSSYALDIVALVVWVLVLQAVFYVVLRWRLRVSR